MRDYPNDARPITNNEQDTADAFDQNRNDRCQRWKRQAFCLHKADGTAKSEEFLEPTQDEDQC